MSLPLSFRVTPVRLVASVVAAAVASGAALAAWATDEAPPAPALHAGHHHAPGLPGLGLPRGPMLDHLLDQVDASSTQRTQVHHLIDTAMAARAGDRAADRADHEQLMTLFAQPTLDPSALEAVRQRMAARHDAATRAGLQVLVDVGGVLRPEQRARLVELAGQARERHAPGGPGAPDDAPPPGR